MDPLLTYQDMIERLGDYVGGDARSSAQREIFHAITEAYDQVLLDRDWTYYNRHDRIQMVAPQDGSTDSSTVTYVASTRLLTLLGATWPTWAQTGTVVLDGILYFVQTRVSDTVLKLDAVFCPQSDISTATTYTIYKSRYVLDYDVRKVVMPRDEGAWSYANYVSPDIFVGLERHLSLTGGICNWTIMQDRLSENRFAVCLSGYPDTSRTIDFVCQRYARPLVYSGYGTVDKAGVINIGASTSNTVGVGTTFQAGMVGSILRLGTAAQAPEGRGGPFSYVEQHRILTYVSGTRVILEETSSQFTSVKYRISDPIDMDRAMLNYFIAEAKYRIAIEKKKPNDVMIARQQRDEMRLAARAADNKSSMNQSMYDPYPSAGNRRLSKMPMGPDE